jgi:hypothetical protein
VRTEKNNENSRMCLVVENRCFFFFFFDMSMPRVRGGGIELVTSAS